MQNRDIEFTAEGKAILSRETYEELRMFCRMHGETDLPTFQFLFTEHLDGNGGNYVLPLVKSNHPPKLTET